MLFAHRILVLAVCVAAAAQSGDSGDPRGEPFDLDAAFTAAVPPRAEAGYTTIPWRTSLTDALAEARAAGRPIYLYVNDGDVASGRC